MIVIAGYQHFILLYESSNSLVYRALREEDQRPVILKILKQDYPTPQELTRYRQEYEIARSLDSDDIAKVYSLEPYQNTLMMCIEDFGGKSLRDWLTQRENGFPLDEFINLAIQITHSLARIHAANIVHKDINPGNIVFNPATQQLKLIDFGIATQLNRENPTPNHSHVLEGTLAYLSPEQTGRMNRSLDYRTDFYSLGVTFYELLTGTLPFTSTDALELIHCHIAKQPPSVLGHPSSVSGRKIPQVVADIVMKLMAKMAEDRYQSAWGLLADLQKCRDRLETTGRIDPFPLGSQDICDRFQIPQKLYGREQEVSQLLAAFQRISTPPKFAFDQGKYRGVEMMLVAGYSGIGKSSLVAEIYKPIAETRGYFISGKFDQFQRNIPYFAIVQAFTGLVRQLLTETQEKLERWRDQLLKALAPNARVIIDVIPEIELIIGSQPSVPKLEPTEAQNRFNLVFQNFLRVFATTEHPLVIFLDDLQWADAATLKLIELIMTETKGQVNYQNSKSEWDGKQSERASNLSLLMVGAYRDNEVGSTHLLRVTLEGLQKAGAIVNRINLSPLEVEHISALIADTFQGSIASVKPLAKLVKQKTRGNPFFVNQFLNTLYSEKLIAFNPPQSSLNSGVTQCGFWQWNIAEIEAQQIADNVVELMILKLKKLPESTQRVLRLAACIGAKFDLKTLSTVCEQPQNSVFLDLKAAIQSGLILPTSELNPELLIQTYKFLHDRVQQAAYALIKEAYKQEIHLQIGRLLLAKTANPTETRSQEFFEIVDHFNLGVGFSLENRVLSLDKQERKKIAKLNLIAGQKAKAAAAYDAALGYFQAGLKLLENQSWKKEYDLTFSLYEEAAEAAYLIGNFEQMKQWVEVVKNQAKTLPEQIKIYEIEIQSTFYQGNPQKAIKLGLRILKLLGINLDENPSQSDIQSILAKTAQLLGKREIESLIDLPLMTDPEKLGAIHILAYISTSCYMAAPALFLPVMLSKVNLSIEHGNAEWSPIGYMGYGLILCGAFLEIESGYRFGKLALKLAQKLNSKKVETMVLSVVSSNILHWKEPCRNVLPILNESYYRGIEVGNFDASFSACHFCIQSYFAGCELTELEQKMTIYNQAFAQIRREVPSNWMAPFWEAVRCLLGHSQSRTRLMGEACNEEQVLARAIAANERTELHLVYLNKLILCYLFGEYVQARKNALLAEAYLESVMGMIASVLFHFYDSLTHLNRCAEATRTEREAFLDRVNANQAKFEIWARHCPENFLHKFHLVEAEKARVLDQIIEAEEFYEQAISGAKDNGFIQEEALAYELAARFYLARSRERFARMYLKEAHYAYERWGAKAKVEDLEMKYPRLLSRTSRNSRTPEGYATLVGSSTSSGTGEILDLASLTKASQAIASEIALDKLLAALMKILLENAGAQVGHLILETEGQLRIEATGEIDCESVSVLRSLPLVDNPHLASSIVNYVFHTQKSVVLHDATSNEQFASDPYIKTQQPKSILCAPLLNQGQLSGIVYLENNLTAGAFNSGRLEILQLLSGQAAIAIDNARLYANLEQSNLSLESQVAERTKALQQKNEELATTLQELKATQDELIQTEKMAALGQLVAGVAHEVNTPLGAIRSSIERISNFLNHKFRTFPLFFRNLSTERQQDLFFLLERATQQQGIILSSREKRNVRRQLERQLEEEGILDANIVADTLVELGLFDDLERLIPLLKETEGFQVLETVYQFIGVQQGAQTISIATSKAAKVVFALKTYARSEHSGLKVQLDVIEGLESILALYQNQFRQGIEVQRNYGKNLPRILGYADELNQVWTNLIHNAIQAMDNQGTLTVEALQEDNEIKVSIIDSGKGIPSDIKDQIFLPFFTTKPSGEGSGLGLDVVKKVVEKHDGRVEFESQPGRTIFTVFLLIPYSANGA
jgi:predicted ATPase/signal transduction histidine kinase/tRNA A-37 threonylcarbamoyl transferase component Bud32